MSTTTVVYLSTITDIHSTLVANTVLPVWRTTTTIRYYRYTPLCHAMLPSSILLSLPSFQYLSLLSSFDPGLSGESADDVSAVNLQQRDWDIEEWSDHIMKKNPTIRAMGAMDAVRKGKGEEGEGMIIWISKSMKCLFKCLCVCICC